MKFKYTKMFNDSDAEDYFNKPGYWEVANIKQQIGWPERKTLIEFREKKLLLLPEDDTLLPCIAFRFNKPNRSNDARILINQYLSSLAWVEGRTIYVVGWTGGGPHPFRKAKSSSGSVVTTSFQQKYLPDPSDERTRLALALYREALSLNHIAYGFLSYYKIINLRYNNSKDQKKWIDQNLKNVTDRDAIKRRDELSTTESSISDYIYVSCRCAIAHAGTEPTVNPEDFEDEKRLSKDLPLMKNLAELMIEYEFGIKSTRTIYKEHNYELYGFKDILDADLVKNLKQQKALTKKKIAIELSLSIRLRGKIKYLPFENLSVKKVSANESDGILHLFCVSNDSLVLFNLDLDFHNERLKINPFDGIIIYDNEKKESSIYTAEYCRFLIDYFLNGQLEVWNYNNSECLSQCDPYLPVNVDVRAIVEKFKRLEEFHRKEAELRKSE